LAEQSERLDNWLIRHGEQHRVILDYARYRRILGRSRLARLGPAILSRVKTVARSLSDG
jgi:hypothetical protein